MKIELVSRPEDGPWSSVQDDTGTLARPASGTMILAIDRVLLPADERARI